jgi:chromosome segregation ATPase
MHNYNYSREYWSLKNLFLLAVAAGFIAILLSMILNSKVITVTLPVGVMLAYIYVIKSGRIDQDISTAGDSCYYLGFILTLISMVLSLFVLSTNKSVEMASMIGAFGTALTTTITGLVARLYFTSLSGVTSDRIKAIELEIEDQLKNFQSQLHLLVDNVCTSMQTTNDRYTDTHQQLNSILAESNQKIDFHLSSIRQEATDALKKLLTDIAEVKISKDIISAPINDALNPVITSIKSQADTYENLNKNLSHYNQQLTNQISQNTGLIKEYVDKVENSLENAIDRQTKIFREKVVNIGNGFLKDVNSIYEFKELSEKQLDNKVSEIASQLDEISSVIKSTQEPIMLAGKTVELASEQLNVALSKMQDGTSVAQEFSQSYKNASTTLENVKNNLCTLSDKSIQLHNAFAISTDACIKLEKNFVQISKQAANAEQPINELTRSTKFLNENLGDMRTLADEVLKADSGNLSHVIRTLTKRMKFPRKSQ